MRWILRKTHDVLMYAFFIITIVAVPVIFLYWHITDNYELDEKETYGLWVYSAISEIIWLVILVRAVFFIFGG